MKPDGEKVAGTVEGYSRYHAAEKILEHCDTILTLRSVKNKKARLEKTDKMRGAFRDADLADMCSRFANHLTMKVTVGTAASIVASGVKNRRLKRVLDRIAADADQGRSLSDSFGDHGGGLFPESLLAALRAGEDAGNLVTAFWSAYNCYYELSQAKRRIRRSTVLPVMYLAILILAINLLLWLLNGVAGFIVSAAIIALTAACMIMDHTEEGRIHLSRMVLHFPILGNLFCLFEGIQLADLMSMTRSTGLTSAQALSAAARDMDNYYIGQEIGKLTLPLLGGKNLGSCLRTVEELPSYVVDRINNGDSEYTFSGAAEKCGNVLYQYMPAAVRSLWITALLITAVFLILSVAFVLLFR